MLSLQSFLREGRVVGPCWKKLKPKGPKGCSARFTNHENLVEFSLIEPILSLLNQLMNQIREFPALITSGRRKKKADFGERKALSSFFGNRI